MIPILVTPFDGSIRIDFAGFEREIESLLEAGAGNLGLGLSSEVNGLSAEERGRLVAALVKTVDGRVGVVVGTGGRDLDQAIAFSRSALDLGVDYLLVTPPRPDPGEEAIFRYYQALSDAVAAPIIVQDAAAITGVSMSGDLMARMGLEIERVEYAKLETPPTPPKFSEVHEKTGGRLKLIGGGGGLQFWEELQRGAIGSMPGAGCAVLFFMKVWNLLENGEPRAAFQRYYRYLPLLFWASANPSRFLYLEKEFWRRRNIIGSSAVRPPFHPPSRREQEEFEILIDLLEIQ